jgi:glycosyltransferase involved in cell wall biosynthesis
MDIVAEAAASIRAERSDAETVIAGSPKGLKLEPAPGVSLMPYEVPAPAVHALMRQASCLLHMARFDASPHVLYEAMQYGTPVIATRVCGIPEAVGERGGILIDRPDAGLLAHAMRILLRRDESETRSAAWEQFQLSGGWAATARHVHEVVSAFVQIG